MPLIRIAGFSKSDLNTDQPPHTMAQAAITQGNNFRFKGAQIEKVNGYTATYPAVGMGPLFAIKSSTGTLPWLLALGFSEAFELQAGVWTDVTGALSINTTPELGWTGEVLNGVAVATNGVDNPLSYDGTTLATLDNWPPADLTTCTCRTLRSYKNSLIAGYTNEDGTEYPQALRWSHPADPGEVPVTWDITDETRDAGRKALSETPGYIVDSLTLGDVHVVYKNDSTFLMQYIGGAFIYRFTLLSATSGLLSKNCVVDIGAAHIALTQNDVVMVTPQGVKSIADNRVRKAIFNSLSVTDKARAFLFFDSAKSEVWVCYSTGATAYADKAFVWNSLEDKWQCRSLPNLAYVLSMPSQDAGSSIDADSGTFDSDSAAIDSAVEALGQTIGLSFADEQLYTFGVDNTEDGTPMTAYIEHQSYDFADAQGAGPDRMKHVTRIRPHVSPTTQAGTTLLISVGTQLELGDAIEWGTPRNFVVGTDRDVYFRANGRYISWRVASDSDCAWALEGLDIEYRIGGVY